MWLWDVFINGVCASSLIDYRLRGLFFRLLGMKLSKQTAIHKGCHISGKRLVLQKGSYIN